MVFTFFLSIFTDHNPCDLNSKTHQKDAVVCQLMYTGLPSTIPPQDEGCKEPYTLTVHGESIDNITRDHKRNLLNAVLCELGEGSTLTHNEITSHMAAHFYGHFLHPGNRIALHVPDECPRY